MSNATRMPQKVSAFTAIALVSILAAIFAGRFLPVSIYLLAVFALAIFAALFFAFRSLVLDHIRQIVGEAKEVAQDILDSDDKLKQLNAYLDSANSEIRKMNKEVSSRHRETELFVYRLSNDFLGPLNGIENLLMSIKKRGGLERELNEQLNRTLESVRFMTSMVNDLLHLAKAGNIKQESSKVDLFEVAKRVQSVFADDIRAGGFEFIINEPLDSVFADKNRVFEIMENLVGNSIKFRKDGVTPRIEIGVKEADEKFVTFFVKDNGIGITKENQDAVFKMFYSVHETDIGGGSGTGMGLAIVKQIAESYGGKITVESERKQGTTMFVTLPAVPQTYNDVFLRT